VATKSGKDKVFGTADDKGIVCVKGDPVGRPCGAIYDNTAHTVTLDLPVKGLAQNKLYYVTVNGTTSVRDLKGNALDGDETGGPGGDFTALWGRGSKFSYLDSDGDKVSLRIKPGTIKLQMRDMGTGPTLDLVDTDPLTSVLSGKVKQGKVGDGRAPIQLINGIGGLAPGGDLLPRCSPALTTGCFDVGAVMAAVDSLLETGELSSALPLERDAD
jgi:hypothetical protein